MHSTLKNELEKCEQQECDTLNVKIFMAGNYELARQICNNFCFNFGCCVTISPTQYIYSGGEEAGFVVGLINYPRFPRTYIELYNKALELALGLRESLNQDSFTIQGTNGTTFYSWRHLRPHAKITGNGGQKDVKYYDYQLTRSIKSKIEENIFYLKNTTREGVEAWIEGYKETSDYNGYFNVEEIKIGTNETVDSFFI